MNSRQQQNYDELIKFANENGWHILSETYSCKDSMQFQCIKNEKHIKKSNPSRFRKAPDPRCLKCYPPDRTKTPEERFIDGIEKLGGKVVGKYVNGRTPVDVLCEKNHDCYATPNSIRDGSKIKCDSCHLIKEGTRFKENVEKLGGTVVGEYTGSHTPTDCLCRKGHKCKPTPNNLNQGSNMCIKCAGRCPEEAAKNFRESIEKLGGKMVGKYTYRDKGVECLCWQNHTCFPTPDHIKAGQGMCIKCSGKCPEEAAKNFKINIEKLDGIVIGKYIDCDTGVECLCWQGHTCYAIPTCVQQGQGMCRACAGKCPIEAEKQFKIRIEKLGGKLIGEYDGNHVPVECLCKKNHICWPSPASIQQGRGMCLKCADKCPIQAAENFNINIEKMGGKVIGQYVNCDTGVECLCDKNHTCRPSPTCIQQGQGMCCSCARRGYSKIGLEWLSLFENYMDIQHAENGGELEIGFDIPVYYWKKSMFIDGYCEKYNICFEFDGCLFHGCDNDYCKYSKLIYSPLSHKSMDIYKEKTWMKHHIIRELGYKLVVITECEYSKMKRENKIEEYVQNIINKYV